jgi:hypothetical protein
LGFAEVRRGAPLVVALASLLSLVACSSASSSSSAPAPSADDGTALDDASDGEPAPLLDAAREATPVESGTTSTEGPAGRSGADAFCAKVCAHQQHCGAADASGCDASCQMVNESSTTNPPTELLRADYVDALASCIAASSCDVDQMTSEESCAESIVLGNADAGIKALAPTQAVTAFCHDLDTSPCFEADSGTPNCTSSFAFFSDVTLNAAISCFTDATCSAVVACNSAAFTQP